ncbi:DUF6707 family protein [Arthrobacter sp. ISL-30]|uniref:DUF6707 family protein n=1 Tax=Arthrobacter sp. ISL-30 TaxID=2819109 RepID=UPI001BEAD107|nr:DUF6707 family protein [Arthrobacter sp. ISL-30]MBT2515291.1 hypothetical protein [Arthrobacter sp. ISL-30]
MPHSPAAQQYVEKQAGALRAGDSLLLPEDGRVAEISEIEVQYDDFQVPALLAVTTHDGGLVRIAVASTVAIVAGVQDAPADPAVPTTDAPADPAVGEPSTAQPPAVVVPPQPEVPPTFNGPTPEELALIPEPNGTPERVVAAAAEEHPGRNGVLLLSERLAKGINTKSGSCLRDLSDLANELFVVLKDWQNALAVADLLNVLPFDGNPGRWTSIERALALSAYIARENGMPERAEVYEKLLKAPESGESDPFKARMNAKVRQRALNEPNLYDKEIFRAMDNSNHEAEREWRLLRLDALLFLRAHGGSETIAPGELERRIGNELDAIRA